MKPSSLSLRYCCLLLPALQLPTRATQAEKRTVCLADAGVLELVTKCEEQATQADALGVQACTDGRRSICDQEALEAAVLQIGKCFTAQGLDKPTASCKQAVSQGTFLDLHTCLDAQGLNESLGKCQEEAGLVGERQGAACLASREVIEWTEECEEYVSHVALSKLADCLDAQGLIDAVNRCEDPTWQGPSSDTESYPILQRLSKPKARYERPSWGPAFADAAAQGPDQPGRTTHAAAPQTPDATLKDGPAHATSVLPFPWVGGAIVCAGLALGVYAAYQAYQRLVAPAAATAAAKSSAPASPTLSEHPGQEALASQPTTGQATAPDQRLEQGGRNTGTFFLQLLAIFTAWMALPQARNSSP